MARLSDSADQIIAEFRANDGKVGGDFAGGTFIVLHTTGAKTGQERLTVLEYLPGSERLHVFAVGPAAETPKHPGWYHNLIANPEVFVEFGTGRVGATTTVVPPAERAAIWESMIAHHPHYGAYRDNPFREIPVVALDLHGERYPTATEKP